MELIRIQRDDSPDGVLINAKDFNPALHKEWVKPEIEPEQTVEIAGLQEVVSPPKKTSKKKATTDDLGNI